MIDAASPLLRSPLFRGLPPEHVARILAELDRHVFSPGEVILREGERGDSLFLVERGLVEVVLRAEGGPEAVLSQLGQGEAFGEMAMLTGEPRSAAIRAVLPTTTRMMRREQFLSLAVTHPLLLFNLSRMLVGRLSRASRSAARARDSEVIAIVGPVPGVVSSLVCTNLAAALSITTRRRILLVDLAPSRASRLPGRDRCTPLDEVWSRTEQELEVPPLRFNSARFKAVSLPEHGSLLRAIQPLTPGEAISWMRRSARYVVLNLCEEPADRLHLALSEVDRVYFLVPSGRLEPGAAFEQLEAARRGSAGTGGQLFPVVLSGEGRPLSEIRRRTEAVLGLKARAVLPGQGQLLRDAAREAAPLVEMAPHLSFSRGARWLARDAAHLKVGVALGAGGARGFAHVGVFRLLEQHAIPNDFIAGTSMGSVIGAPRALGMDISQGEEVMRRLHQKFTNLMRPTLSLMSSLLSPKGAEETFRELVGDATFEELAIPFAAVAADLETASVVVLMEGSVAQAIRASSAIPMVWPPVTIGRYRLVDGGVLNPVPTQPTRDLGADVVIAVDLSGRAHADEAPTGPRPGGQPNIFQNLLRCHDIMMADRAARDCLLADVVIRPRFETISWKQFDKADLYAEAGYRAAAEAVPALRKLLPWMAGEPA